MVKCLKILVSWILPDFLTILRIRFKVTLLEAFATEQL